MFCVKCGKEISNDALFCSYCGKKVAQDIIELVKQQENKSTDKEDSTLKRDSEETVTSETPLEEQNKVLKDLWYYKRFGEEVVSGPIEMTEINKKVESGEIDKFLSVSQDGKVWEDYKMYNPALFIQTKPNSTRKTNFKATPKGGKKIIPIVALVIGLILAFAVIISVTGPKNEAIKLTKQMIKYSDFSIPGANNLYFNSVKVVDQDQYDRYLVKAVVSGGGESSEKVILYAVIQLQGDASDDDGYLPFIKYRDDDDISYIKKKYNWGKKPKTK